MGKYQFNISVTIQPNKLMNYYKGGFGHPCGPFGVGQTTPKVLNGQKGAAKAISKVLG